MAIRRCPYCKAIIDEEDKYCNNCGTQLLFPEDESIEEEIPGDKIIEEEEEEVEKEEFEEGQEEPEHEIAGEEEEEEEKETSEELEAEKESEAEEYELSEEESEMEEAEKETGEWESEEEILEEEEPRPGVEEEEAEREEGLLFEPQEKREEEETEVEEEENPAEKPREDFLRKEDTEEAERKYEVSLEKDELVFKTKELEGLTKTVDEGKKEIEEFLASREEKKASLGIEEEEGERVPETREELPPWVSGIRDGKTPRVSDQKEERREVQKPMQREWTTDSGVGLPEKLTQTSLPFTDTGVQGVSEVDESREEEEEALGQEAKGAKIRRQRAVSFPGRIKCRFVDLGFITALWLISLLFAAQVIGVSFFRLMSGSLLPVLGLYFILLFLYFFLFLYFLGETLGDHYFSEED